MTALANPVFTPTSINSQWMYDCCARQIIAQMLFGLLYLWLITSPPGNFSIWIFDGRSNRRNFFREQFALSRPTHMAEA